MNRTNRYRWVFGLLTMFALASLTLSQESPLPNNGAEQQEPIEVLTRGPIHEAFAQPVSQQPVAPTPIGKAPPAPISEDPPQERPDLENAQWIPGYWAWEPERQAFLWVSGVQRVPPQGRTFVPGYWENTPDGWRWIHGFWSDSKQQAVPYTPEPPAPLEDGIQQPPPDNDSMVVPGSWIYRDDRFIWRGGYWSPAQLGRVWVPSQYIWTPNGYLFINGYWDEPYDARGIVYAPVFFHQPLWRNAGWRYRPNHIVSFGAFFDSAFVCGGGYYFGNYYDPRYARLGYNPWFTGRGRYDPVFAYNGWQNNRNNPNWLNGVQQNYASRSAGRGTLPPSTFAQQTAQVRASKATPVVAPAAQFKSNQVRLVQSTPTQLDAQRTAAQRSRDIAVNRQQIELAGAKQGNIGQEARTLRLATVLASKPATPGSVLTTPSQSPRAVEPNTAKQLPKFEIRNNPPPITIAPPVTQPKVENRAKPPVTTFIPPKVENQSPPPAPTFTPPTPKPAVVIRTNPPTTTFSPPPAQPKVEIRNNIPPATIHTPTPAPRIVTSPPPAPKFVAPPPPAPKFVAPPPPAPKFVAPPPAPRIVTPPPAPTPRINNPAPPPRVNNPAPVRNNPPPAASPGRKK